MTDQKNCYSQPFKRECLLHLVSNSAFRSDVFRQHGVRTQFMWLSKRTPINCLNINRMVFHKTIHPYLVYSKIKYQILVWCGFDRASSIICGNKMPTRCNRWIFIADRIACSTCFGQHYAHHQELESIIQVVAACRIWCLVFKLSV
jgi:hypothetical protein